jgi:hypothetical protein
LISPNRLAALVPKGRGPEAAHEALDLGQVLGDARRSVGAEDQLRDDGVGQ